MDDNPFVEGSESSDQLGDAIDDLGIEAKVSALEVALSPDSVEVVDETTARRVRRRPGPAPTASTPGVTGTTRSRHQVGAAG